MHTEIGPTVATAASKDASLLAGKMALYSTQFEPMFDWSYLHFWSCKEIKMIQLRNQALSMMEEVDL